MVGWGNIARLSGFVWCEVFDQGRDAKMCVLRDILRSGQYELRIRGNMTARGGEAEWGGALQEGAAASAADVSLVWNLM